MINKTFDVVYRVAPPILTNWENFLQMKWKEAFGYANIEHQIQAFEILSPSRTPRYIISFVNECVVLQQTNAGENYKIYNIECDKDKLSQYLRNQIPYIGNKKALDILQKNGYKLPDRY